MNASDIITDNELMSLIKDDNEAAFNEIYKRYWKNLYNQAFKRLNNSDQCEEVVQNVFADLWLKRANKNIDNVLAYLSAATRYQIYMLYKKSKSLPYFEEPLEHMAVSPVNADSSYMVKELKVCIAAWLETQPEKRKEIFRLRYLEDLTTKEISTLLDISQKTVQNQLNISLYSLRSSLAKLMILEMVITLFRD